VTLSGTGIRDSVTKCHKGEGGGLPKCHLTFFCKILNHIFIFWPAFLKENACFWKIKNVTPHRGGGEPGGSAPVSPNDTWGRWGSKIGQKVSRIIWMTPYNSLSKQCECYKRKVNNYCNSCITIQKLTTTINKWTRDLRLFEFFPFLSFLFSLTQLMFLYATYTEYYYRTLLQVSKS